MDQIDQKMPKVQSCMDQKGQVSNMLLEQPY